MSVRIVLLPQPDGPSSTTNAPPSFCSTLNSKFFNTSRAGSVFFSLNRFETLMNSTIERRSSTGRGSGVRVSFFDCAAGASDIVTSLPIEEVFPEEMNQEISQRTDQRDRNQHAIDLRRLAEAETILQHAAHSLIGRAAVQEFREDNVGPHDA